MTRPIGQRALLLLALASYTAQPDPSAWSASPHDGLSSVDLFRVVGLVATAGGIVLLILVQYVYRKRLSHSLYHRLLLVGLFLLPLIATWSTTATVMEGTKSVQACMSCHVMHPFVNDMTNPESPTLAARHYKNEWIAKDQCYACHVSYGVTGTMEGKRDGLRHWLHYVTNTYRIRFSSSAATPTQTVYPATRRRPSGCGSPVTRRSWENSRQTASPASAATDRPIRFPRNERSRPASNAAIERSFAVVWNHRLPKPGHGPQPG